MSETNVLLWSLGILVVGFASVALGFSILRLFHRDGLRQRNVFIAVIDFSMWLLFVIGLPIVGFLWYCAAVFSINRSDPRHLEVAILWYPIAALGVAPLLAIPVGVAFRWQSLRPWKAAIFLSPAILAILSSLPFVDSGLS
jgi:hypothetical protein